MRLPRQLLRRSPDTHKGDYGHIFILAGSPRFSGAAVLCAWGALRSGAGLVTIGIPKGINNALIKIKPKEVMTLPLAQNSKGTLAESALKKIKSFARKIDVLVIGPGLAQDKDTQALIRKVIAGIIKPRVIDADALNALSGKLKLLKASALKADTVITPHSGEMSRLLRVSIKEIQAQRLKIARRFAKDYRLVTVLKGHRTVVADYRGQTYINSTGNPGMATGGSGDVLTGMIGAFLGQKLDAFSAAKFAVYLHGLAGDLAAKDKTQISLIASDIIEKIPPAIKLCS